MRSASICKKSMTSNPATMVSVSSTNVCESSSPSIPLTLSGKRGNVRPIPGRRCAAWQSRGLSYRKVLGHVQIRAQPHAARYDVTGQIAQSPIISIRVGSQPDKGLRDPDAKLLGHHPGGLIDLRAVNGQLRGLAARARSRNQVAFRLVSRVEQQHRRRVSEDQRITKLEVAQ